MRKNITKLALLAVLVAFVVQTGVTADTTKAPAADPATGEEINWQVISSGGTDGSSTNFALKGTVAQTAVGYGSSASYGLNSGFWQKFGCCNGDGIRGNVDGITGPAGEVDINDLTYLVAYMFGGGPPPPCIDEGNVDGLVGPAGPIDINDLTYLVAYMFGGGPPPAPCP